MPDEDVAVLATRLDGIATTTTKLDKIVCGGETPTDGLAHVVESVRDQLKVLTKLVVVLICIVVFNELGLFPAMLDLSGGAL